MMAEVGCQVVDFHMRLVDAREEASVTSGKPISTLVHERDEMR